MLEIKDKLSIPCKEVKTITSNSDYLFAVSNSKNKVIKYNKTFDIEESFNAFSYADYTQCVASACDNTYLYLALSSGEVIKKHLVTKEEQFLLQEEDITGMVVSSSSLVVSSQRKGTLTVYNLNGIYISETTLNFSAQGLTYDSENNCYYTIDSVKGIIVTLKYTDGKFIVENTEEGISPFADSYFEGDIEYFNNGLVSCDTGYLYVYQKAPYTLYVKEGAEYKETSLLNILRVPLGQIRELDLKLENSSSSDWTSLKITLVTEGVIGSYLQISTDGVEYTQLIEFGEVTVADLVNFKLRMNVPLDGVEGESYARLDIECN